jgi:hypothetical protein
MNQILMKPDTVIGGYGSTPAGWQGVAGPEGTQIQRPVQGSKPYMEATDDLNDMRVALSEIDRLMGLVDKHACCSRARWHSSRAS